MRRFLRGLGAALWRFMVIFSFIVNFVLVLVLIVLGLTIFDIKNNIAQPIVGGLHSTAKGLEDATIDWTIPVRDQLTVTIPEIPINRETIISEVNEIGGQPVDPIAGETVVTLTRPVPLTLNNAFIQSNDLTLRNASVQLTLPQGTRLPVSLDLAIALENAEIPVDLDVRAVIPLQETQLNDPIQTLGLQFEPLAIALHNLPNNFSQTGSFVTDVLNGEPIDQLLGWTSPNGSGFNPSPYIAWPGYSQTAGLGYDLFAESVPERNRPINTGLVPPGGIPALDAYLRPELYSEAGSPEINNDLQGQSLDQQTELPPHTYQGSMAEYYRQQQQGITDSATGSAETGDGTTFDSQAADESPSETTETDDGDFGIIGTPTGS